ncbi:CC0125/CC1285 family lipoprotein [Hyphomicrobium sp.]|uniref:CC0125/CC1285 family lipoprotein n=1 Tax=Hyphomicrobium sp. TaxID=82 RepID=UPI003F711600
MRKRATAGLALSNGVCALLLAGCSGTGIGSTGIGALAPPGPLPYQHANAIMPVGYSESLIGEDRYRIEVKGPLGTPRERMEKIATTRAAEIGQDAKHKYFKVEGVQLTTACQSYTIGGKPGSIGAGQKKRTAQAILTADVTYAKAPSDPAFVETRGAFERYRAELDQDQTPSIPADPATSQCG